MTTRLERLPGILLSAFACALLALPVTANDYTLGDIVVAHPWTRATAEGMPMGVAYFTLTNQGARPDALIAAHTEAADSVEIHQTSIIDGVARMRPVPAVDVAPGKTVKIEPGGIHLMLVGLKTPLRTGDRIPLSLEFRSAGKLAVLLIVQ